MPTPCKVFGHGAVMLSWRGILLVVPTVEKKEIRFRKWGGLGGRIGFTLLKLRTKTLKLRPE